MVLSESAEVDRVTADHGRMPLAVLLNPHFVPACFVVFVGLRLLSVICLDTTPTSDAAWYFERAVGLANGAGYSEGGLPTAFWPIGYPAILSAVRSFWLPSDCWTNSQHRFWRGLVRGCVSPGQTAHGR